MSIPVGPCRAARRQAAILQAQAQREREAAAARLKEQQEREEAKALEEAAAAERKKREEREAKRAAERAEREKMSGVVNMSGQASLMQQFQGGSELDDLISM